MPVVDLLDLPAEGALLGLDPGTKTVGVAVSDATRVIATGLETVRRTKFAADAERLFALYDGRSCAGIVVGLPVNMDGTEGPRAQSVRAFARNLLGVRDVPLAFWDERWSTAGAERVLIEADASRARRKQVIDAAAAAYILQGALDRLKAA
jgi:putative Holliday junction resolvase